MQERWQCRMSPTIGDLEANHREIWGTDYYIDQNKPTVFFGCYGLPDFMAIRQHKGRKAILWAGTDLLHLKNGYWLDQTGKIRLNPQPFYKYFNEYCENYTENVAERDFLRNVGVASQVVPSFLGDVKNFKVNFKPGNKLYTSVSGDDFERYGWDKIPKLAEDNPEIEFHMYGNEKRFVYGNCQNLYYHGRVPKEQMNEEIKEMQGCLRLIEIDGFSEIVAKAMLMGQYPVSVIEYPNTIKINNIKDILTKREPNLAGREWVLKSVNKYPWAQK